MSDEPQRRITVIDTTAMYKDIGNKIAGKLICEQCKREKPCPPEDAAKYLRTGWPKCCGYTMMLEKRNAVAACDCEAAKGATT